MKRSTRARIRRLAILCLPAMPVGVVGASGVQAQSREDKVDGIVAIVADTAILQSELQEFVFRLRAQGIQVPQDPVQLEAFLRQSLEQKINEVLFVVHAQEEGVTLTSAEMEEEVENRIATIRRQFQSEAEFQQALAADGVTAAEYRIRITEQIRAEMLAQRYLQMKASEIRPVPVSEEEIAAQFEAQKANYGARPATITLKQVVLTPEPSDEASLMALEEAERVLSRARSGEDFVGLAAEYSDDPGTKDNGGELGWVRQGDLVTEFESVLFGMQVGDISDIVQTPFGYHIIKLDRVRGAERSARHILIRPEMTSADTAQAHALARALADSLRTGADIESLIQAYSDPNEQTSLTDYPQDRLPQEYQQALQDVQAGDIVEPFQMELPGLFGGKWIIIKVLAVDPGGEWTLDDARETIRAQIQQERMLLQLVEDLKERTYIERRFEGLPATR